MCKDKLVGCLTNIAGKCLLLSTQVAAFVAMVILDQLVNSMTFRFFAYKIQIELKNLLIVFSFG